MDELYTAIKAAIQTGLPEIKHVALFNNQFYHSNSESDEIPFLYPCVFLEFSQSDFKDLSQGVQQFEMIVSTHLGFESYKNEDLEVLRIKQRLYVIMQRLQQGYFARLTRIAERQDFDHQNTQVYVTDYRTTGKDFERDIRPTLEASPTIILSATTITLSGLTI